MEGVCDTWSLYRQMFRSRLFEEAVSKLWEEGLISGEMHLGTGEEAVVAGISDHLIDGDALALDHRGTPPLIMRGVDPFILLREMMGKEDGLCSGMGGHMHLFSKEHLAASSGIVGASGPAAAGFALAAKLLRPGTISVAYFGDGSVNQGMMMEAMNLAVAWHLPVLFVCKDDSWAITTESNTVTGGSLSDRARGLGLPYEESDGVDVDAVWNSAKAVIERIRGGSGPAFLHAKCVHLEGHFLGYQLLRVTRNPLRELPALAGPLSRSMVRRGGASARERAAGLGSVTGSLMKTLKDPRKKKDNDPVHRTRRILSVDKPRLQILENEVEQEIRTAVRKALEGGSR